MAKGTVSSSKSLKGYQTSIKTTLTHAKHLFKLRILKSIQQTHIYMYSKNTFFALGTKLGWGAQRRPIVCGQTLPSESNVRCRSGQLRGQPLFSEPMLTVS